MEFENPTDIYTPTNRKLDIILENADILKENIISYQENIMLMTLLTAEH